MNLLTNNSPVELMLMTNKVKRTLLPVEGLTWTDLLVICVLHKLEQDSGFITPALIIDVLKMDKCWVYRAIRRLETKQLIIVQQRPKGPSYLSLSGWGNILIQKIDECMRGMNISPVSLMR